ncbi:MAG: UDP-N-acetylglucosamine--N-acetylmuramyl-(pentapeptide) pyrophosphoryl-undecaprenol N-acetylglucosamine transferase [Solirubrobacteraceae bacterium]
MHQGKRIAIAAGGTAGHVVPALAVADALLEQGASVFFIGADRAERELVPAAGYELQRIVVEGLERRKPRQAARALLRAASATARARKLLSAGGAEAVLGGGGYVAGPVTLAAAALRLPLVLCEADSHLGLSNRVMAPLASRVCLAFPLDGRDGRRYRVTGRPVPPATADREASRSAFEIGTGETCVLVFGGSLGARSINRAAFEAFSGAGFRVLHVAGNRDYPELAARPRRRGYDLREYLQIEEFGAALAASDLVVARAGGSIFEIASYGRPAVLVPYPHASGDHQRANAEWMRRAGAAVVLDDEDLHAARLAHTVGALLADPPRLVSMARASAALARPHAAREIAREVLTSAGG